MLQLAFACFAAVAFAASLLFFLYAYLVLFGEPAGTGTRHPALGAAWNVLLFTVFALHHSLFARTGMKQLVREHLPPKLERALYVLVASVLFFLVAWLWLPLPDYAWRLSGPWRGVGYAVQAAGILLTFLASRALDVLDLAGVRPLMRASRATPAPLVTSGVFGLVRHPLYFGWTLLVFMAPDMTYTRLLFAVVSTAYLAIAIPFEERSLVATFGAEYTGYQGKVRWRMLPGLY